MNNNILYFHDIDSSLSTVIISTIFLPAFPIQYEFFINEWQHLYPHLPVCQ